MGFNNSMQVVKRDGRKEDVSFDKVLERIRKAAVQQDSLSQPLNVNATAIAQRVIEQIYDGVRTSELDELACQLAISLITLHPDNGTLAARIAVSNHQKNTEASFTKVIEILANQKMPQTGEPFSYISKELIDVVREHGPEIDAYINHDRDYFFDYFGFKTLEKSYLLRDATKQLVERPQHMWMRVALALWSQDLPRAFETYDLMSTKKFTHATPTLFNAGTPRQQCSSCFLMGIGDSIAEIYKTLGDCAAISKHAGGIGLHAHTIRARGSVIRGTNGISNGIVPMLRVFNNTARYVDQCFTPDTLVYTDTGHKQISDIQEGEKVLTSDGEYHTVRKCITHFFEGTLTEVVVESTWAPLQGVRVTGEHPVLSVFANGLTKEEAVLRIQKGLIQPEYNEVKDLNIGDYIISSPSVLNIPFMDGSARGTGVSYKELPVLNRILSIKQGIPYKGILHDFEIDGPHDYTVVHLGVAHNGGGKRNGSFAIYLEPWHADVEDFLCLKLNNGTEGQRARDLFYALWIPDLFMERVDADEEWSLFCPNEAPGLADVYGETFNTLYKRYEREGKARKTIPARKLWFQILDTQIETGTPYLLYKDAANQKSNQKNLGTIKSSNLCVAPETLVYTPYGEIPIQTLEDKFVEVWNGTQWNQVQVKKTGVAQPLIRVTVKHDQIRKYQLDPPHFRTLTLDCTPYHKFILDDHKDINQATRLDAKDLLDGMRLYNCSSLSGLHYTVVSVEYTERIDDTYCFNEPMNHAGVFNGILTGNCTEIIEYSDPDEQAVCNLASIGLPAFVNNGTFDFDELRRIIKIVTGNLNRVIDMNYYPTPETKRSNMRHRPIGIGIQGLADVFAALKIPFESVEAARLNQLISEHMYFAAVEASMEATQELVDKVPVGPYETFIGSPASLGQLQPDLWGVTPNTETDGSLPWTALRDKVRQYGLRNSLLIAPMPTASTSQILGYNECFEPFTTNLYERRTLAGAFPVLNKYLLADLLDAGLWTEDLKQKIVAHNGSIQEIEEIPNTIKALYKTVWEIKMRTLIDMAADRGAFICQSQSLNLFVADPTYAKLTSMHLYAWKRGLKTGCYYLRTKPLVMAQQFTVEPQLDDKTKQKAERLEQLARDAEASAATCALENGENCVLCSS